MRPGKPLEIRGGVTLGVSPKISPTTYPLRPFYLELPNGMRHWFETLQDARKSQAWPRS